METFGNDDADTHVRFLTGSLSVTVYPFLIRHAPIRRSFPGRVVPFSGVIVWMEIISDEEELKRSSGRRSVSFPNESIALVLSPGCLCRAVSGCVRLQSAEAIPH